MKLEEGPDDPWNRCYCILRSPRKFIMMGVYPVMYGFRIRAWFAGRASCNVDWCAGDSQEWIERLYSILANILESREEDFNCFMSIPGSSLVKPASLDPGFMEKVMKLVSEPFVMRTLPGVDDIKDLALRDMERDKNFNINQNHE